MSFLEMCNRRCVVREEKTGTIKTIKDPDEVQFLNNMKDEIVIGGGVFIEEDGTTFILIIGSNIKHLEDIKKLYSIFKKYEIAHIVADDDMQLLLDEYLDYRSMMYKL